MLPGVSMENKTPIDQMSFEEALKRLEELVGKLERGELSLEESVRAFEEGVQLARRCEALLDQAEQKLKLLNDDGEEPLQT